jgi:PAS domain S-box-containing protein
MSLAKEYPAEILERISEGFIAMDNQLVVNYLNKAAEEMLGRNRDDILDRNLFDTFPEAKGSIFEEKYSEAVSKKLPLSFETFFDVAPYVNWYDVRVYPSKHGIFVYFSVVTDRKQAEKYHKTAHALRERVKELNCLYGISKLVEQENITIGEIVQGTADIIPPSWQYPEITCARIKLDGQRYRSDNFTETKWLQSQEIIVSGEKVGEIDVYYLVEKSEIDEGPFLREERALLNAIAERLGRIIEQKQAENNLRKSEQKFKEFILSANDGFVLYDSEMNLCEINDKALEIFPPGSSRESLRGKNILEISPNLKEMGRYEKYLEVKNTGKSLCFDDIIPEPLFGNRHLFLKAFKVGDSLGIIFSDITEKVKAEEELKKSEKRYQQAEQIAQMGHWSRNLTDGKCHWSAGVYKIFGVTQDQFDPKFENFLSLVHPDDREILQKALELPGSGAKKIDVEYRIILANGSTRCIHSMGEGYSDNSGNKQIIGTLVDITEERIAEKEKTILENKLRQAIKMQAVGTLAGGIAHEFNNLLGVIIGCTEMARDEVPINSFVRTQLDYVMKASDRVKVLVKQILTFSRQTQQKRISLPLSPLLKESLKLIQSSIPSSINLEENIDTDCGNVLVDPTEIQQIIMNLFSNAIWATKERGTININLRQVQLTAQEASNLSLASEDCILLSFSDNGSGMDTETKARIFDPFYTTKEVGKGTGMGLAIIYSIMESYGGTILVESEGGKGTTFLLYFPVTNEPTEEKQVQIEDVPKGTERILFVDDEEIYAEMAAIMIGRLGYNVVLKTNSIEALEAFKTAPGNYDLVITDQIMPGLSGEELVKEIRLVKPDMPVILCSGYSSQIDEKKTIKLGSNKFAHKPMAKSELAILIRSVLDACR